jgi:hypothetical protein
MSRWLCALDKCPGVRPVGVGKTWRHATAKVLLLVAGAEAKEACGIDQLCVGLEAGCWLSVYFNISKPLVLELVA